MSWPLWDLAGDLAVARGGGAVKTDPMERVQGRNLRWRLAALAWIPGGFSAIALGSATGSWVIGLAAFVLLIAGLLLFASRGARKDS